MDRDPNRQQRQSSLPSSLIPHLFSGPQQPRYSQTRTTLQTEDLLGHDRDRNAQTNPPQAASSSFDHHRFQFPPLDLPSVDTRDRHLDRRLPYAPSTPPHRVLDAPSSSFSQQYGGPIYSDPVFHPTTQPSMRQQTFSLPPLTNVGSRQVFRSPDTWREGEAGPSSLLRPISHDEGTWRHGRVSNQPVRVEPRSSGVYRSGNPVFEQGPPVEEHFRHRGEGDTHFSSSDHSWPRSQGFQMGQGIEGLTGTRQGFEGSADDGSPTLEQSGEMYSIPGVGSLSISAPTSTYVRRRGSDSGSVQRSEGRSGEVGSNDGEGSQKGKRRRAESLETEVNVKRTRNPRKTAVACNFCRGRKLRCNGEKPSCYNCTIRKFECEYVSVQRRRGPGKAPKGSRTKKSGGRMETKVGDRQSAAVAEHELDSLAPEVRPYMSVLSLDTFGFQPPAESPQYPSDEESIP